jgi:hypothetical protein
MQYEFKKTGDNNTRVLICPNCDEYLMYADIEIFRACPFCNKKLQQTGELEDFILEPIVQSWVDKCISSSPDKNIIHF